MIQTSGVRDRFNAALDHAQGLASVRLAANVKDRDALFAMTLSSGLRADYAALIEKKNMSSLHYTREANDWADQLLAVDPNCYDARVATGFSKYIIGSMAAPVRWFLRMGGVSGDKKQGIVELQMTADHGQYLGPFARILLAIAYVRDKDDTRAPRQLLAGGNCRDETPQEYVAHARILGAWMQVIEGWHWQVDESSSSDRKKSCGCHPERSGGFRAAKPLRSRRTPISSTPALPKPAEKTPLTPRQFKDDGSVVKKNVRGPSTPAAHSQANASSAAQDDSVRRMKCLSPPWPVYKKFTAL